MRSAPRTPFPARAALAAGVLLALAGCSSSSSGPAAAPPPRNVIFFLGDGMGMTTLTAARIYSVGEDGELTIDTLPETGFVKTYSNDAQVTDSAPSMAAYMTGVKSNNEVISMSPETRAFDAGGADYLSGADSTCPPTGNGAAVTTLLELAKAAGRATGVVTTTRVTHATPAATYAHVCHRDAENTIAAQLVPGGAGFNTALGSGVDVVLGGGRRHFLPAAQGGARTDGRDLVAELKAAGWAYASSAPELAATPAEGKLLGLFSGSHMAYDLDRDPAAQPSLAEMTRKALDVVTRNPRGFFLMVEGGRIDHALHETTAKKALQDTVAFDAAIAAALERMQVVDPGLKNTLVVVTADHDHTLVLNGYARRTGPTSAASPGVLGLVRNVLTGAPDADVGGLPYTVIGFGNGERRPATRTALDDAAVSASTYHQEAAIPMPAGGETHGGTDVFIGAAGLGAERFTGVMDNTAVFTLVRQAAGL